MKKKLLFILLYCLSLPSAYSQILSDSARLSLLTCTPGYEVYSKYGHSAIRVYDPLQKIDVVFNYGIFNFATEHFYAKFVKGETYYQLGVETTENFILGSSFAGRTTYEQELNLTKEQRESIYKALLINYQPSNRYYLYNFVFDNCATRPFKLIETALQEEFQTPEFDQQRNTYRELITYYSEKNSWTGFGINLIFGRDADKELQPAERLFLPEQLMNFVSEARMSNGQKLCLEEDIQPFEIQSYSWWTSPYIAVMVVVLLLLFSIWLDLHTHRTRWWIDAVLFFVYGVIGLIGCYLSFFSIHPLVKHNFNLLFLNPLMFIPFILTMFTKGRKWLYKSNLIVCLYFYISLIVWLFSGQSWHLMILIPIVHFLRLRIVWYKDIFIIGKHQRIMTPKLLLLLSVLSGSVVAKAELPRLTVVVAVEGLNNQSLEQLRNYWPAGGMRTLDEEAHEYIIDFPQLTYGGPEALATICTGTTPAMHGIAANYYFNRSTRLPQAIMEDTEQNGIGTTLQVSPKTLLTTTYADEFRMQNSAESQIYAIGIHPEATMLLAGHAANACTWLNDKEKRWATTTYYSGGLPTEADQMNMDGRMTTYSEKKWTPRMDIGMYIHTTDIEKKQKGFSYNADEVLTCSPITNELIVNLALDIQQSKKLGSDRHPDLLSLQLTVRSPKANSDLIRSAEQEDMYLSLNQNLGFLIEQLNKRIGREHYRLIVFGTPKYGMGEETYQRANMQAHIFDIDRAAALINTYLMAIYGHERWIDGGYLQSIYLNHTIIEQKKMPLLQLQQQVSNFLMEFEGIQAAFPNTEVPILQGNNITKDLQQSYNKQCFGDVLFTLQPMWSAGKGNNEAFDAIIEPRPVAPVFIWTASRTSLPEEKLSATDIKNIIIQ